MENRKLMAIAAMVAVVAVAFGSISTGQAQAGATTYPVEVAANGGVGGCQGSTGNMTNVTYNTTASAITIQCPSPNGFAWGRLLDTPDELVDAALVDDGSDVTAAFKQTGSNNSRGRKLGLAMRIGDMRVKDTDLVFEDATVGTFASDYDLLPNGKVSKRANLKLRLPKGADLLDGTTARCKQTGETAGVAWTASDSAKGRAYRAYQPTVLVDCGDAATASVGKFRSLTQSMTPDPNTQKLMTGIAECPVNTYATAGGYDIAGSTTSQWPLIVANGPDLSSVTVGSTLTNATKWKVIVAVPSDKSSAARAKLTVWVTCN